MTTQKPLLALTMGDPAGIGPEIVVKAAVDVQVTETARVVVFGSPDVLQHAISQFLPLATLKIVTSLVEAKNTEAQANEVICYAPEGASFSTAKYADISIGEECAVSGKIAFDCIVAATEAVLSGEADAIVTAPVNKASINRAGVKGFSGHTELIAEMCDCTNFSMQQSAEKLHVSFVTTHIPLREVVQNITKEKVIRNFHLLYNGLLDEGIEKPKVAFAAINPHAGENGYMGNEDIEITEPAVRQLQAEGFDVEGPFPPDTLFIADIRTRFDGIVCMYHDQGHIPFKMLAFDVGVNSTLGLPIIRTSVDHGTAFNLAWQGKANTGSLLEALKLATLKSFYKKRT